MCKSSTKIRFHERLKRQDPRIPFYHIDGPSWSKSTTTDLEAAKSCIWGCLNLQWNLARLGSVVVSGRYLDPGFDSRSRLKFFIYEFFIYTLEIILIYKKRFKLLSLEGFHAPPPPISSAFYEREKPTLLSFLTCDFLFFTLFFFFVSHFFLHFSSILFSEDEKSCFS